LELELVASDHLGGVFLHSLPRVFPLVGPILFGKLCDRDVEHLDE